MKDISSMAKSKDVIVGLRINKESVYYVALFSAAFIVAIVLAIVGSIQNNKGLEIYSYVLIPIFLLSALTAGRYAFVSKDTVFVKEGELVIKKFFITRKFEIASIEKLTAATNNKDGVTTVNVVYDDKTYNYKFNSMTREEIAHLRRASSKH